MIKTRVEDNEILRCMYCANTTERHVDRARTSGWRVLMSYVICPTCWNQKGVRHPVGEPMPYDVPMF